MYILKKIKIYAYQHREIINVSANLLIIVYEFVYEYVSTENVKKN